MEDYFDMLQKSAAQNAAQAKLTQQSIDDSKPDGLPDPGNSDNS